MIYIQQYNYAPRLLPSFFCGSESSFESHPLSRHWVMALVEKQAREMGNHGSLDMAWQLHTLVEYH